MSAGYWLSQVRHGFVHPHRSPSSLLSAVAAEVLEERLMLSGVGSDAQPDFHLTDVNTSSSTSGQAVSPRDYLEQVSAWYFGRAT
jgi:hypothetical protein